MFLANDVSPDKQIALFFLLLEKRELSINLESLNIVPFVERVLPFVVFYCAMRIGGFLSLYFLSLCKAFNRFFCQ